MNEMDGYAVEEALKLQEAHGGEGDERVKASVLRGADVGRGCVLAAHTVVRTTVPAYSVVAGVPGRVVRDRSKAIGPPAQTSQAARRG